ncbi:hypothetical protein TWF481_004537 [Arthrobotrys musiformis]|uniref:F-box domain-containing protein n=1 Tax=Arthrobotrys musiformis TaxID=47236 RepID=A0AAV9WJW9_9PEZI
MSYRSRAPPPRGRDNYRGEAYRRDRDRDRDHRGHFGQYQYDSSWKYPPRDGHHGPSSRGPDRTPSNWRGTLPTPDVWSKPTAGIRWPGCAISKSTTLNTLKGLKKPVWDEIMSYLSSDDLKNFGMVSRACRVLAAPHLFEYVKVNGAMVQKFKRELSHLRQYLKRLRIDLTDIRWVQHLLYEVRGYSNVNRLHLHFVLQPCVETTVMVAALRQISYFSFYQSLVHLDLTYEYNNKMPFGFDRWYEALPKEQQEFLGLPITKAQASELIGSESALAAPLQLETAILNVAEGLNPAGIYYKFLATAPNLKLLDIETWMPPAMSLEAAPPMFPRLQRLRVGLKEGFATLPTVLAAIVGQFTGLVSLQLDGFADWWGFAYQSETIQPESLDCIIGLQCLKTLIMPCPAVLGPKKAKMTTLASIYRLCPKELEALLRRWVKAGMLLHSVTFDGYIIHPRERGHEYFELYCYVETRVEVCWNHKNRPSQLAQLTAYAPASHGLVPCNSGSGVHFPFHIKLRLELQSIRPGVTDALGEVLTQLSIFPAVNKLSITFVSHRESESALFLTALKWISECSFYHNVRSLFIEAEICDTQISAQDRKDWYSKCHQRDQLFLKGAVDLIGAHGPAPPMNLQEAVVTVPPQRIGKQLPYYKFLSQANKLKRLTIKETVTFPKDFETEEEGRKWSSCVPTPVTEPTVPNTVFYGVKSLSVKITGYPFGRKLKYLAECFPDLEELDLVLDEAKYRTAVIDPDIFIQTYDGLLDMKKLRAISIPWPKLKDPSLPQPLRNTFRKTIGKWMSDNQTDSDMRMLGIEELEKWVLYWQQCQLPLEKVQFNGWKSVGQWHSVRKWAICTVGEHGGLAAYGGRRLMWEECDPAFGE